MKLHQNKQFQTELEHACLRESPDPETYERILRKVMREAGGDESVSYAAGLEQVERLRRQRNARRRGYVAVGVGCLAVAACFGLYFMPSSQPGNLSGNEMVVIEEVAPPLNGLPEGLGAADPDEEGQMTLRVPVLGADLERIDWLSVHGVDEFGNAHQPVHIDQSEGLVTFAYEGNLSIHALDLDGNILI